MKEYQVSYRGNRLVTRDNIIDVLNELGYQPGGGEGGLVLDHITNWYLLASKDDVVTMPNMDVIEETDWTTDYEAPYPGKEHVWRFTDYCYKDESNLEVPYLHIYTTPELITIYTSGGGMGVEFAYALFDKGVTEVILSEVDEDLPISESPNAIPVVGGEWTKDLDTLSYDENSYLWMSQRKISADGIPGTWEKPIRLSGADGDPGADAFNTEFIYKRLGRKPTQNDNNSLRADNERWNDDYVPRDLGWTDNPQGVDNDDPTHKYEWIAYRTRIDSTHEDYDPNHPTWLWSNWSDIKIWAAYGEKGMDGDGIEYVYKREWSGEPEEVDHPSEDFIPTTANPTPDAPSGPVFIYGEDSSIGQEGIEQSWNKGVYLIVNSDPTNPNNWRPEGWDGGFNRWKTEAGTYNRQGEWVPKSWEDEPQGVDENHKKEYVSQRKRINGIWGEFSTPTVWATFSKEHTIWIDPETGLWWIDGQETNIKAEGKNGKGIDLKGRVTFYYKGEKDAYLVEHPNETVTSLQEAEGNFKLTEDNIGDCFVVEKGDNGGHIYLYLGPDENDNWEDNWQDFGEFQGEGSYVHIAWAHYYGPDEFGQPSVRGFVIDRTANPIEYEWMGICTNHEENDPGIDRFTEYKWNYVHGRDGDTFERVYVRTTQKTVPPTIGKNQSNEYDPDYLGHTYQGDEEYIPWVGNYSECGSENHGSESTTQYRFTDDPLGPNLTYPYEWMAERKKVDGVWQDFNTPSIHSNYSHDGQSVVRSTVFKRSTTAPIAPYGGSFLSPYPTDTNWKDGLPPGEGLIWMSSKIFTSDEQDPQDGLTWPTPTLLKDSEDLDIEFSNQPKTGTPIPPIDYDKPGGNRHNPEEPSGYDHSNENPPGKKQLWFDPEQDAAYISAHATEFNWMATRTSFYNASNDSMEWRDWVILLIKGETGEAGDTFEHAYLVFPDGEDIFDYWPSTAPTTAANTPPNSITVTNSQGTITYSWVFNTTAGITVGPEQALWMTERKVSSSVPGPWSDPIKISGNGTPGEDAEDIEFIYKRSNNLPDPEDDRPSFGPNSNVQDSNHHYFEDDDFVPGTCSEAVGTTNEGWFDNPSGVDPDHKYEWMCQRVKPRGTNQAWQDWSRVFVWSAYGDTGMDGDGIEYVYTRTSNPTKPNRPKIQRTSSDSTYINWDGGVVDTSTSQTPVWRPKDYTGSFFGWIGGEYNSQGEWVPEGWTDDPQGVDENNKKEYVSQRKRINGVWGDFTDPAVWSTYSHTPVITIGPDGCWWVDGETTGKKAEGPQGQGIQLKDTVDVYSINDKNGDNTLTALEDITPSSVSDLTAGDCYVVKASRYLYVSVYDGETWDSSDWTKNWDSIGEFQGQPGEDGVSSYMHIAWALAENVIFDQSGEHITDITEFETWAEHLDPELDYEWMGICTDDNIDDSDDWQDYKWNHVKGKDGDNYERVYVKTKVEIAPGLNQNSYDDPNGDKTQDEFLPLVLNYDSSIQGNDNPYSNYRFTDDPSGVTAVYPYEWVAERKKKKDPSDNNIVKWFDFSSPALWAKYSFDGNPGVGIQTRYTVALIKTGLTISNPSGETPRSTYTDSNNQSHTITWQEGTAGLIVGSTNEGVYYLWMTQRSGYTGNWENWTTPIRISGEDGKPGVDGPGIEFIFKRQGTEPDPPGTADYNNKTYQQDDYVPQYWEDSPVGVDNTPDTKYEWACQRVKLNGVWQGWSPVFLWSAYGETGMDGDGVEYVYFRRADAPATPIGPRARNKSNSNEKLSWYGGVEDIGNSQNHVWVPKNWDATTNGAWSNWEWDPDAGYYNNPQGEWIPKAYNVNGTAITNGSENSVYWSDDPSGVTMADSERKEWVSTRKRVNGTWDDFDSPKLWASFGTDIYIDDTTGCWVINGYNTGIRAEGEDGKGVALKGSVHVLSNSEKGVYSQDNNIPLADVVSLQDVRPNNGNTYSNIAIGDCYVVKKNRYLYTCIHNKDPKSESNPDGWDYTNSTSSSWTYTTNWGEIGEFQGADGDDGVSQFVHIAWTTSDNIIWDSENPNEIAGMTNDIILAYEDKEVGIEYDWMGICRNEYEEDPEDWQEYKWNHVRGKDGSDYEKVYVRTNSESVIPVVNQNTGYSPGHNIKTDPEFWPQVSNYTNNTQFSSQYFTDDPHGVSAQWPYEWVTERRKVLNSNTQLMEWGTFDSPAKLWATYSFDGMSAYLTRGSDSVTVDAAGNVVGGYGDSSNPRIYTEVKIYDPKKDNGNGTYGGYLSYTPNTTVGANQFKLSATGTNCTANKTTTSGKVYVNPITNTSSDNCSIAITATISNGKTFIFNFPVTLNHIPQTYLTYTLTNDSDVFTYRTRTQKYDGLPIETCLEVQTTDGTVDSLGDNTLKENGYVKSVTVVGKGDTNFLRYAKIRGTNVTDNTILVEANTTSSSTSITHTTKTAVIYKDDGRSQDTGLRLEVKSDGNVKLYRTGTTDLDLEDTKHDLDISCVAVLGDVEYQSPVKTFSLSEKNDITLYKLVLSSDTFIKDETGGYSPLENTFNVKVNVSDETGTTTIIPTSTNDWLIRNNVKVRYINGAPATNPGSDTLSSLSNLSFSGINNNFFTVVVVEYDSSNQPILYHDVETVDIVPPGVSQVWMDYTPDRFVVDCDADGIISSTTTDTVRTLNISAYLRWGNLVCTDFDTSNTKITLQNIGSGNYVTSTALNRNTTTGEVSIGFRFSSGKALTSGQAKIRIKGTFSNGISKDVTKYVTIEANRTGEPGDTGQPGDFKSTAFIKTYTDISTWLPTGGTYSSPFPTDFEGKTRPTGGWGWEDGIPAGEETLWSSTATFYGSGAAHTWSFPKIVRDSETYDVEFALKQANGSVPSLPVKYDEATTTNKCNAHRPTSPNTSICTTQIWYDPEEDSGTIQSNYDKFYWKAEREIINGSKKPWVITQIKGESEPNVMCNTPIIVIETDPTGKLSSSENTFTFKTWLRLGETIQIPTSQDCTNTNSSIVDTTNDSFNSSDNSIEWTVDLVPNTVLSNVELTVTISNASCSASKTIQVVFERKNQSQVKSFIFKRFASQSDANADTLITSLTDGVSPIGSFTYPSPGGSGNPYSWNGWSDGLPTNNTDPIYMSSRLFTSDGLSPQQSSWSTPVKMSDTEVFDVEFSPDTSNNPGTPPNSPSSTDNWYDPNDTLPSNLSWEDMVWMATRTKNSSGSWGSWKVMKIKGEKGDPGTGISLITPYYKISTLSSGLSAPAATADPTLSANGAWATNYIKPTRELPFLWKFTRTTFTDPTKTPQQTDPEIIQVWSENMINPNLLDDTEFFDNNHIGGWNKSIPAGTVYYKNEAIQSASVIKGGTTSYYSGRAYNQYYVKHKLTSSVDNLSSSYIVFLSQVLYDTATGGVKKINTNTWYTLSFYCYARYTADSAEQQAGEVLGPANLYIDLSKPALGGDGNITWTSILGNNSPVVSTNTDTAETFTLTSAQGGSWTKIIVTFKTKSNFTDSLSGIEFKLLPLTTTKYQCVYITEPKLEIGQVATEYVPGSLIREPYPRLTEWKVGQQYYQGTLGEPYLDVVSYGGNWFRCRTTHVSRNKNEFYPVIGQTTKYWDPAQNFSFIATNLLLAETAFIENLFAKGLGTGTIGQPHIEMSGATLDFYGTFSFPNIRMMVDGSGMSYLRFIDSNNVELYDLGPSGIKWLTNVVGSSWSNVTTKKMNSGFPDFSTSFTSPDLLYLFSPKKVNGEITGDEKTGNDTSIAKDANGLYFISSGTITRNTNDGSLRNLATGLYRDPLYSSSIRSFQELGQYDNIDEFKTEQLINNFEFTEESLDAVGEDDLPIIDWSSTNIGGLRLTYEIKVQQYAYFIAGNRWLVYALGQDRNGDSHYIFNKSLLGLSNSQT